MSKKHKYLKAKPLMERKQKTTITILAVAVAVVLLLIILLALMMGKEDPAPTEPSTEATTEATEATTEATEAPTEPPETTEPPREMLPRMKELYEQNDEVIGWVRIDDTKLDYPVMHTPDDKFKYDHLSFEETYDYGGVPYLKYLCDVEKPTVNLLIYGHNMANGTQFRTLMSYTQKKFWEEHPTIYFSTLYEEREYEIIAAFYDQIYYEYQDVFKYYDFLDPQTEEEFNEGIEYFKHKSLYDTGVEAQWGDQLITLVTCAYHVEDGRFVVVGRLVEDEPAETTEPTE